MENRLIHAMVMILSEKDGEIEYKNGVKYAKSCIWWDEVKLNERKIPVVFNYSITKGNIIGVADKFELDKNNHLYADIVTDINDEDDEIRLNSSLFVTGINIEKTDEDGLLHGKIDCISAVHRRRNYPYRTPGYGNWKVVGKIDKSAIYAGLIFGAKGAEVNEEKIQEQ